MSRYADFVNAFTEPEKSYPDREPKDILFRFAQCFIEHIGCPDDNWCYVYRDVHRSADAKSKQARTYRDDEDSIRLEIRTAREPVGRSPFGTFSYAMYAKRVGKDQVEIDTSGPKFTVTIGDVRWGAALDEMFASLMDTAFTTKRASTVLPAASK